jgi:penicillin-binding protein 2
MKNLIKRLLEFTKSRLFIMLGGIFVLFTIIAVRLFSLQIINGQQYQQDLKASIMQNLSIPASRGTIYDKYGRPLATNQVAFSVKFDDSIKISLANRNKQIAEAVSNSSSVKDTLPISQSSPRSFTFSSEEEETNWKESIGLIKKQLKMTADEVYEYLLEKYNIDEKLSEAEKRKIISLSIEADDKNLLILSLIQLLKANGETLADELPISKTQPYVFLFDDNKSKEEAWKKEVAMKNEQLNYSAEETIEYLCDFFDIPSCLSEDIKRDMISVRYSLYLKRYRKYQPVTIALNVNSKTVSLIEEKNDSFPGVYIDTDSLRCYNAGEYFSHILGYIGKISDTEYEELKDDGYTTDSIIGKSGVESLYEKELNGVDGERVVEVDA